MDMNNYLSEFFYQCERCNYKTNILNDMKRHIEKKFICKIKNNNYNLTEEEFKNKTLQKKYNIDKDNLKNSILLNNNINSNEAKDKNDKKCKYCNYTFHNKYNIKRHEKVCKIKNFIGDNNQNNIISNSQNNLTNNIIDINLLKINLNDNQKILNEFYNDFDTKHISDMKKIDLCFSVSYIYSLNEILKNEINLNFYINEKTSYIFKNTENAENCIYLEEKDKIYRELMHKIKDFLINSLIQIQTILPCHYESNNEIFKNTLDKINKKYNDYIENENSIYSLDLKNKINNLCEKNADVINYKFNLLSNNYINYKKDLINI